MAETLPKASRVPVIFLWLTLFVASVAFLDIFACGLCFEIPMPFRVLYQRGYAKSLGVLQVFSRFFGAHLFVLALSLFGMFESARHFRFLNTLGGKWACGVLFQLNLFLAVDFAFHAIFMLEELSVFANFLPFLGYPGIYLVLFSIGQLPLLLSSFSGEKRTNQQQPFEPEKADKA